jgi:hypothetical protein
LVQPDGCRRNAASFQIHGEINGSVAGRFSRYEDGDEPMSPSAAAPHSGSASGFARPGSPARSV